MLDESKTMQLLSWDTVIDRLGGTAAVALALDTVPSVVSGWRKRGIPASRWRDVTRLARAKRLKGLSWHRLAELSELEASQ